ncbi:uncharacterized protein LAESUDRAFT_638568, partial [Laetiporus sulphureus 93-53]
TITKGRLLFTGTTVEENRPTVIKFSHRYSEDVHRVCAKHNCVPSIIGTTLLPSRWNMTVMELIADPWVNIADAYNTLRGRKFSIVREQLKALLSILREGGFVHGDLRDTNILVNTDTMIIKVVDFEWAGKEGEAQYPAFLNVRSVHCPQDVQSRKLIKYEHDEEMI